MGSPEAHVAGVVRGAGARVGAGGRATGGHGGGAAAGARRGHKAPRAPGLDGQGQADLEAAPAELEPGDLQAGEGRPPSAM